MVACRRLNAAGSAGRTSGGVPSNRRPVNVKYCRPQNNSTPISLLLLVVVVPCTMMCRPAPLGLYSV